LICDYTIRLITEQGLTLGTLFIQEAAHRGRYASMNEIEANNI